MGELYNRFVQKATRSNDPSYPRQIAEKTIARLQYTGKCQTTVASQLRSPENPTFTTSERMTMAKKLIVVKSTAIEIIQWTPKIIGDTHHSQITYLLYCGMHSPRWTCVNMSRNRAFPAFYCKRRIYSVYGYRTSALLISYGV